MSAIHVYDIIKTPVITEKGSKQADMGKYFFRVHSSATKLDIKKAVEEPVKQIAKNAGKDGAVIVDALLRESNLNIGYNAKTDKFEDMFKAGVIDPTKVARSALQNAASIAGLILTTEAMVTDIKDKKGRDEPDMSAMGGMSGMGGPVMM